MSVLKKLPLHDYHKSISAKFAPFAGWDMPLSYGSSLEEHRFVRKYAGIFDVSHMGEILVEGVQALNFLNFALTNDLSKIRTGQAQYTLLCSEDGGTIDDLIVYKIAETKYLLCVNASNTITDFAHLIALRGNYDCEIHNQSDEFGQLAIQGPCSADILCQLCERKVAEIPRMHCVEGVWLGTDKSLIARTGYTGEDGFEIYCSKDQLSEWVAALSNSFESGKLCWIGLAARDTLRLEAGFPLHGHELSDEISPVQAGLSWAVGWDKEEFLGSVALRAEKENLLKGRVVHYAVEDRRIPRSNSAIVNHDGKKIGRVLSGGFSPLLEQPIGTAMLDVEVLGEFEKDGAFAEIRGKLIRIRKSLPAIRRVRGD